MFDVKKVNEVTDSVVDALEKDFGELAAFLKEEQERQNDNVELIASENFVSAEVLRAMGTVWTNKYTEGYPAKRESGREGRYYGGCHVVDKMEEYCCKKWREVFNTDYHVNVQPHSGSQANYATYLGLLNPGDKILSMSLASGGHLTHSLDNGMIGNLYEVKTYDVNEEGLLDYDEIEKIALEFKPNLILAGASAYSRVIDFNRFREIADKVGAIFMVDMAHIAGLIAGGEHPTPFGIADVITTTCHKTLRGVRGGIIFAKPELAKKIDSGVFPRMQGGSLQNAIYAKAVTACEALTNDYKNYIKQVVKNSKAMCQRFIDKGIKVVSGGTDNHLFMLDLGEYHFSGKDLQDYLDTLKITLNKNCVPNEKKKPSETSGVRIGTAAMTTKGWKEDDFIKMADKIIEAIDHLEKEKNM